MNLIYQYWNGDEPPPGALASVANMREYAEQIGAQHRFCHNDFFVKAPQYKNHTDSLRPLHDPWFDSFDKVLFLDADVFAVDGLSESVFDVPVSGIGICAEPHQPEFRDGRKHRICGDNDRKWARFVSKKWNCSVPMDNKGRPMVFNSGVILYTREGVDLARKHFIPLKEYVLGVTAQKLPVFYAADQNYIHSQLFRPGMGMTRMSCDWNALVHGKRSQDGGGYHDGRTPTSKFVHVQLSGFSHNGRDAHERVTNNKQEDWNLP
jgi:hypothetical protein